MKKDNFHEQFRAQSKHSSEMHRLESAVHREKLSTKVKAAKLPDSRDVDDFEALLVSSENTFVRKPTSETTNQHDPSALLSNPELLPFDQQSQDQQPDQRSAGLDYLTDSTANQAKQTIQDAKAASGIKPPHLEANGQWETFDVELPSLGVVTLTLKNGPDGLCFRIRTNNSAIDKLMRSRSNKVEQGLSEALKMPVRFLGLEE